MPALTPIAIERVPLGNRWLLFGSVTPTAANQVDDHFTAAVTGLAEVEFGSIMSIGNTQRSYNVNRNTVNSGVAEGTTMGAFAFETSGTEVLLFLIIGR